MLKFLLKSLVWPITIFFIYSKSPIVAIILIAWTQAMIFMEANRVAKLTDKNIGILNSIVKTLNTLIIKITKCNEIQK